MKDHQEQLKNLYLKMKCTCVFLYFFRNNFRYTNRYYSMFIEIIGMDDYLKSAIVRNEWDAARYNFDKMYGLLSGWVKSQKNFETSNEEFSELKKSVNNLVSEVESLKNLYSFSDEALIGTLKSLEEGKSKELLNSYISLQNKIYSLENEYRDIISDNDLSTLTKKAKKAEEFIIILKDKVNLLNNL